MLTQSFVSAISITCLYRLLFHRKLSQATGLQQPRVLVVESLRLSHDIRWITSLHSDRLLEGVQPVYLRMSAFLYYIINILTFMMLFKWNWCASVFYALHPFRGVACVDIGFPYDVFPGKPKHTGRTVCCVSLCMNRCFETLNWISCTAHTILTLWRLTTLIGVVPHR